VINCNQHCEHLWLIVHVSYQIFTSSISNQKGDHNDGSIENPAGAYLHGVWSSTTSGTWAVGFNGEILRWNGSQKMRA
jgi:hypothetical protein